MKFRSCVITLMLAAATVASAQMSVPLASSHAPTMKKPGASTSALVQAVASSKPAVRVNGAVLTETDIVREMFSIFPYASQHNGFPKDMEPEIRKGATNMVIFEELLYQEAKRRQIDVPAERITKAYNAFRGGFPDKKTYDLYLTTECKSSMVVLREKIGRSMLNDKMLKTEVDEKAAVTEAAAKAYYDANPKQFEHAETFQFQTISIIPPADSTAQVKAEAKAKITDALRLARETKDYKSFGVIAEQISEDDWHTKMGDRGKMNLPLLPPVIGEALRKMKVGQVSDVIGVGDAWVILRLEAHNLAGKESFAEAKGKLMTDLKNQKRVEIRAELNKKLRKDAKIEML